MPIPRYLDTLLEPLDTDSALLSRVGELIGTACASQTWMLFLDELDIQLPALIPIDDLPERPGPDDPAIAGRTLEILVERTDASAVIVVIERPGSAEVSDADSEWADVWRTVALDAEIRLRAVVLSHDDGVVLIEPDEATHRWRDRS